VDPHIFADLDPGSQNLTDPDPKHCTGRRHEFLKNKKLVELNKHRVNHKG